IGAPNWFGSRHNKTQLNNAEIFILQAFQEAKKINYVYGMAKAISLKADLAFEKYDNYFETEKLSREAIALYKRTLNKEGLNKTYWRLGTALHSQSKFEAAINNYDTGYNLSEKTGDSIYILYSVVTLAYVYLARGDYKRTFEKLLNLHQLVLKNNNIQWKCQELDLLGTMYWELEDRYTALRYYQREFQLIKPNDQALADFAELFAANKQFDSAKYYYSLIDTSNQRSLRFYLKSVGAFYCEQKQYNKALPNLLRSLNYNRQD